MGCKASSENSQGMRRISHSGIAELKKNYLIKPQLLGAGVFGKVFLGQNLRAKDQLVAIKVLSKEKIGQYINMIQQEVKILSNLDHPNIVKYYETYEDKKYLYLITEYCNGGELIEKITRSNQLNEKESASITLKLLHALAHCHAYGIAHRDIKPENIMIGNDNEVKLIDFGLSKQTTKNQHTKQIVGTPYYMSPEVLNGYFGPEGDVWSCGIVLYLLLSGSFPFNAETREEVFEKIQKGEFNLDRREFSKVSSCAKDLIRQMLTVDKSKRISASEALKHEWFSQFSKGQLQATIDSSVLTQLKQYKGQSQLKKAAMNVLVKMLDTKQVKELQIMFQKIDTDNTGYIEANELAEAIKNSNADIDHDEITRIIKEIDYHGNEKINYSEFIAATISVQKFLSADRLEALFSQFDTDGTEILTEQNIRFAFEKLGKRITNDEMKQIMTEHDKDGSGGIDKVEFKKMLLSDEYQ